MAETKNIDQLIREISKKFGEVVHTKFPQRETEEVFSSMGSPSLDFCLYGGLKEGAPWIEFSGPESSGKTTMACIAAGCYQRKHPDKSVLFVDIEGTFDPSWAAKLGLKTDTQFIYYESLGQSGEEILNHVKEFVKTNQVGFVILDSLPELIPEFVQEEDDMNQKSMGGNAKLLSDFVGRYTGLFRKNKVIFIGINQLRDNMTGYGDPTKTTGGRHWRHACSVRLMFKAGTFFDQNGETIKKKDAQSPAGHIIEMYVIKNKTSPWDRKLGFTRLHYWKGIDYIGDLTDVAVYFGLIEQTSAAWFRILNEDKTPAKDEKGEEIKINGRLKLIEYLRSHKEIAAKLYRQVKNLISQKEAGYIAGFEEMLGVDTTWLNYVQEDDGFDTHKDSNEGEDE